VWMLLVRYRIAVLEEWLGSSELDAALVERQAEGAPVDRSRGRVDSSDGGPGADGRPDDGVGVGRPVVPEGAR
jgi:hypothetical protein